MSTTLFELIAGNKQLRYLDAATGERFTVEQLTAAFPVPEGPGLALLYPDNSIRSVTVLLNLLRSRKALVLLSPQLDPDYKQKLEALYAPDIIYDAERTVLPGYDTIMPAPGITLFKNTQPAACALHPEIRLLLSTSGTTGSPKLVKLSEENLVENARSIIDYLPVSGDDTTPLNLPLYYSYGLSVFTTNSIAGGTVVCTNRDVLQKEFWEEFAHYGFTSLAGVPYVYEMLYRIGFCKKEYPSLRYLTQAGGKLSAVMVKVFGEYALSRGKDFFVMYGQTEATARMAWMPPAALLQHSDAIGIAVKNGAFRIDAETGELIYSGPNVSGGYAVAPADLATFSSSRELHTGDLARQDEDGYYYITGRMSRFVKLFGTRVNLDEVEQLLKGAFNGHPFVCLGFEDKYLQVLYQDNLLAAEAVKQLLCEKLRLHQSAFRVKQISEIPLTPNGKPDYKTMRASLEV